LRESTSVIQFKTIDAETIVLQERIGSAQYTYEMVNTDALYREAAELDGGGTVEGIDEAWIDALVGVKYNCIVEENVAEDSDPAPVLLEKRDDGSSTWRVGGWIIEADQDLVPRALRPLDDDDDDDDDGDDPGGEQGGDDDSDELIITGIDVCDMPVVGCDPISEAGDDHVQWSGPSEAQMAAVLGAAAGSAAAAPPAEGEGGHDGRDRLLGLWQDLQNGATRTNWCGQGTPKTNPCPGDPSIEIYKYDYDADRACRRHDHGRKFKILDGGFVRTECMNDRDLILASDNPVLEAVYGWAGLSATFGCYGYGSYKCWRKWRYGCHCHGERIRYGYYRYENNQRNPDWGYYSPEEPSVEGGKLCGDDLWSCDGPNRSDKCNDVREPKDAEGTC
jgi:hypothetical protein